MQYLIRQCIRLLCRSSFNEDPDEETVEQLYLQLLEFAKSADQESGLPYNDDFDLYCDEDFALVSTSSVAVKTKQQGHLKVALITNKHIEEKTIWLHQFDAMQDDDPICIFASSPGQQVIITYIK